MSKNIKTNAPQIISAFKYILELTASDPIPERGRRIEAFTHKDDKGNRIIRHQASYRAYARRLRDFKYLLGITKGRPLDDLAAITNALGGSFRLPFHLYLHYCLPDYPEKEENLRKHRTNEGANTVMNHILGEIEGKCPKIHPLSICR
jgi:hypothetical protein